MHADSLLHKWLGKVLPCMHASRREALGAVISGAFRGGRLTVTSMGRAIGGLAKEKHNIKRSDRKTRDCHEFPSRVSMEQRQSMRIGKHQSR